jgi:sugar/nucleoside kinase (ribokinase family)
MGIPVKLPMMLRTDNIGSMFMAENASSGVRTRHIDTRNHFISEHVEDGFVKIVFVKTDEND